MERAERLGGTRVGVREGVDGKREMIEKKEQLVGRGKNITFLTQGRDQGAGDQGEKREKDNRESKSERTP